VSQILSGFGRPDFTALFPGATLPKFLQVEPLEFSLEATSSKLQAKKYVEGVKTIAASKVGEYLYTLKLGIEAASWTSIQFALGELAGTTASIGLPEVRYATIPLTSPYEISDTDLTTATGAQVFVTDSGTWGEEKSLTLTVAVGAPSAGEFKVDSGTGKFTFNVAQAGAPIAYRIIKTYTSLASIGQEQVATLLNSMSFSGIAYSDKEYYKIIIPKMQRVSVPSLNLSDVTKLEVEFDLQTPQGMRKPFQIFKMPSTYTP
jgi:hypothetical protein